MDFRIDLNYRLSGHNPLKEGGVPLFLPFSITGITI